MNLLKSIFVSLYMVAATAVTVHAVRMMLETGAVVTWGSVLLVYAPFLAVLTWLLLFRNVARTSAHFPLLIVLGVIGVIGSTAGYAQGGSPAASLLSMAGLIAFLVYAYWYSSFGVRHSSRLVAGNMLPAFELRNTRGELVSSTTLLDKPTVWVFYRGNWCPLCMAQVKEIAAQYRELRQLGARVALVSPQPHRNTVSLAKKFDVAFDFLTDEGNAAARALGIAQEHGLPMGIQALGYAGETVLPTVIVTERGGRILWVHETDNYRVRPEPETYLAVLREQGAIDA
jgi:peroxiredoxin